MYGTKENIDEFEIKSVLPLISYLNRANKAI